VDRIATAQKAEK